MFSPDVLGPRRARWFFNGLATLVILLAVAPCAADDEGQKQSELPNIVFILIDDLGWMDLACQGNKLVDTPRIDALAASGMRFTDAYAAAPVCSPTRASILTGKSPAQLRLTNHTPDRPSFTPRDSQLTPAAMFNYLAPEHVTIAERLKTAGYSTGFIGKWHLSGSGKGRLEFEPTSQGFDLNIAGCGFGGPPTFFDPYKIPNLTNRKQGEYLPDRLADEAIKYIKSQRDGPFALFLWFYTVHWPMEAPRKLLDKYADRTGPGLNDTRYGAMIEGMDQATGRVLDALDEWKLSDNTLLIFTSDNGGFSGVADNRPLRAAKGHLYEGGIRVPLIARWPGVVPSGTTNSTPVISMDYYPTMREAANLPALVSDDADSGHVEGVSLMPVLRGKEIDREAIYFHYPNFAWHRSNRLGGAMRAGDWKLIERFDDNSLELYNLRDDLSEKKNLADAMPERAKRMRQQLAGWRREVDAAMPTQRKATR